VGQVKKLQIGLYRQTAFQTFAEAPFRGRKCPRQKKLYCKTKGDDRFLATAGNENAAGVQSGSGPEKAAVMGNISSWGGVFPRNNRSAGKNKSSHTTGGNPWLRAALTECAWAAAAKKGCFLKDKFWRITTKSGGKAPAIVAVAHTVLSLVYEALRTGDPYQEKKVADLNPGQRDRMIRRHVKRLGKLGVTVRSNRFLPGVFARLEARVL
jgi:hypothetical protein